MVRCCYDPNRTNCSSGWAPAKTSTTVLFSNLAATQLCKQWQGTMKTFRFLMWYRTAVQSGSLLREQADSCFLWPWRLDRPVVSKISFQPSREGLASILSNTPNCSCVHAACLACKYMTGQFSPAGLETTVSCCFLTGALQGISRHQIWHELKFPFTKYQKLYYWKHFSSFSSRLSSHWSLN